MMSYATFFSNNQSTIITTLCAAPVVAAAGAAVLGTSCLQAAAGSLLLCTGFLSAVGFALPFIENSPLLSQGLSLLGLFACVGAVIFGLEIAGLGLIALVVSTAATAALSHEVCEQLAQPSQ